LELKEKILKTIRFWELFSLSLPGRISVVKTLCLPILNYLGFILSPSDQVLKGIQNIMDNFVRKGLKISETRLYLPPEKGGLGLFNLIDYLNAQKCTWIVKARKKRIDNWRHDLTSLAPGNDIEKIRICDVDRERHPILYNMVKAYTRLIENHAKINGNYKESFFFNNAAFTWGEEKQKIDKKIFDARIFARFGSNIRGLKLNDCYVNNVCKIPAQFHEQGIPFNFATCLKLHGALEKAKKIHKKMIFC